MYKIQQDELNRQASSQTNQQSTTSSKMTFEKSNLKTNLEEQNLAKKRLLSYSTLIYECQLKHTVYEAKQSLFTKNLTVTNTLLDIVHDDSNTSIDINHNLIKPNKLSINDAKDLLLTCKQNILDYSATYVLVQASCLISTTVVLSLLNRSLDGL